MTSFRVILWDMKNNMAWIVPIVLSFVLVAPSKPSGAMAFYLFIPIFLAWRVIRGWPVPWRDGAVILGSSTIIWSTLCLAWGYDPSGVDASKALWLGDGVCTLAFFFATLASATDRDFGTWFQPALLLGGAGNAIFAIGRHILVDPTGVRMWGWGITGQPVLGGAIMAVLFVIALDRSLKARGRTLALYVLCLLLFGLFMVMSDSRGPLLAVSIASSYRVLRERAPIIFKIAIAVCLFIGGLYAIAPRWFVRIIVNDISRGLDYHVTVWRSAVSTIRKQPLIGYGPTARLPLRIPGLMYPFPHNLYLSILFYSGVIGLILFLLLFFVLFNRRKFLSSFHVSILLVPIFVGFTDLSQAIKGPAAIWYILWIPILINMSDFIKDNRMEV